MAGDLVAHNGDTRPKRRRRSTWSPDVMNRIKEIVLNNPDLSAKGVEEQLKEQGLDPKNIPAGRTLRDMLKKLRPPEPTDTWSLAKASDEEAALVLPVLQEVIERSDGRVTSLSTALAQQIARIRRLIPDAFWPATLLTLWDVYELAVEYLIAEDRKLKPDGADAYLAFAPWRSLEGVLRYNEAVREGSIEPRILPLKDFYEAEAEREELRKREGYDVDENQ